MLSNKEGKNCNKYVKESFITGVAISTSTVLALPDVFRVPQPNAYYANGICKRWYNQSSIVCKSHQDAI